MEKEETTIASLYVRATSFFWRILRGKDGASATLQTLLVQGSIIGVNVATGIITARYLGPTGRGEMSALTVWPNLLAGLVTLGIPSALIYNFRRHPAERPQLFGTALVVSLTFGLGTALAGAAALPYWMGQYSDSIVQAAQLFMLQAPVLLLTPVCTSVLKARDEFAIANGLRFVTPMLTLMALLALIFTDSMTPIRAALCYVLAGVVVGGPLVHLWRRIGPRFDVLWHSGARLLRYGVRSWGINVLGTLSSKIDRALVVGLLAPEAMGIYVVALSASEALRVVQKAVQAVLFPKAASKPLTQVMAMTGRAVRFNVALTALGALALLGLGPFLLRIVYGPGFVEGSAVLRILAVEVLLSSTTMVLAQAFMATDRPGVVTTTQGIGVALSIPLLVLLVPLYGLVGAALALLASSTARFVAVLACFPLLLGERPPWLLLTLEDTRSLRTLSSER